MRWPIRYQLVATYLLVSMLTAGVTYALVLFTSEQRINTLTLKYQTKEMKQEVIAWYSTEQHWQGFEGYFRELHPPNFKQPNVQYEDDGTAGNLVSENAQRPKHHGIVTADNIALIPYLAFNVGDYIPPAFLLDAEPIQYNQQLIAWIIPPEATGLRLSSQLKVFLANIHQILFVSVAIGIIASLILAVCLSRWLLKPMHSLHSAMSSMAKGQLFQHVPVTAKNELGELAQGFNQMSSSIAEADRKRRQLAADISHDLGTPLQVISGYVEMAQAGDVDLCKSRLDVVASEVKLIERLIDDMNLLAKTDSQTLSLTMSEVPVQLLLQRVHQRFMPSCESKQIEFVLQAEEPLPTLPLDEERMLQVLGNLITNSLKHTPKGGRITLRAEQTAEYCELSVIDNGEGIDPSKLPFVFDRFYQTDTARANVEGSSGLGLSIVKGLLKVQGANITAYSDGQLGARFTIQVPLPA
ncbi:HAMP domain-containing histidine kinase [Neiella marina]|uniref:histidine kinase n=1 Tax=Neiella holothuriorum TaxID=2870530 RepID=A0ABS7EDU3_9GAMM|nr:HAMP domain-containing sensor histidine kinase [Neiella holothuriorum]MBW8190503.1 HAMP domain-containing histidine kinase [Neiella holothuriorum]